MDDSISLIDPGLRMEAISLPLISIRLLRPEHGDGSNDTVFGNEDDDIILGGANDDRPSDKSRESLFGGDGNDLILGDFAKLTFSATQPITVAVLDHELGGNDVISGGQRRRCVDRRGRFGPD